MGDPVDRGDLAAANRAVRTVETALGGTGQRVLAVDVRVDPVGRLDQQRQLPARLTHLQARRARSHGRLGMCAPPLPETGWGLVIGAGTTGWSCYVEEAGNARRRPVARRPAWQRCHPPHHVRRCSQADRNRTRLTRMIHHGRSQTACGSAQAATPSPSLSPGTPAAPAEAGAAGASLAAGGMRRWCRGCVGRSADQLFDQTAIRLLPWSATQAVSVSAETKTPNGELKLLLPEPDVPNWAL